MFNESFKYYKSKCPVPDFKDVINFQLPSNKIVNVKLSDQIKNVPLGMQSLKNWKCCTLRDHLGLFVIRNVFTVQGQRYWIARCLRDYPKQPNRINLKEPLYSKEILEDWWTGLIQSDKHKYKKMKRALRWSTLGYHHNWDTKLYKEDARSPFPLDLAKMCNFIASTLEWKDFKAEAAIINYYSFGSTLAGHVDHSEYNLEAPLLSFSFGQTSIFLIGGATRDTKPSAMFLESGDVLVMSQQSRLCYHAVPRIMKSFQEPWNDFQSREFNVDLDLSDYTNKVLEWSIDNELYHQISKETYWLPYKTYLTDSRLNINVRQVLKCDQTIENH